MMGTSLGYYNIAWTASMLDSPGSIREEANALRKFRTIAKDNIYVDKLDECHRVHILQLLSQFACTTHNKQVQLTTITHTAYTWTLQTEIFSSTLSN
jgi:hypothetical protein